MCVYTLTNIILLHLHVISFIYVTLYVLARDAFVRTSHHTISMMSVPSICLSVCLSVRLSVTGVHCDHTVHFSMDLSLWLDSPMFWRPDSKASPLTPSHLFPAPRAREVGYACANWAKH